MSVFDASDFVNAGLEVGSSLLQDRLNTRARRESQAYNTEMFGKRYQMQVADLKAAGLNPMLAYMTGPGGGPSSSAQTASKPDLVGSVMSGRATSAQVANVQADTVKKTAETRNVDIDTMLKGGMIEQVASMTASAMASAEQARAMVEQIKATLPKIDVEIQKMKIEMEKDKSNIKLNESLILANQYRNSLVQAQAVLAGQEAALQAPKVEAVGHSAASRSLRGATGATADIMQNFYKMLNPFYMGGK